MNATASSTMIDRRAGDQRFHFWMASAFVFIAFGGFMPTYWLPVAAGTFHPPAIIHVHGLLLFTWTLFYFAQTALVAMGRTPDHRNWGLAGIALFATLVCSILATKIAMLRLDDQMGVGDAGRRFAAVSLVGLPLYIGVFALAIAKVRKPETHKRLMLLLMVAFMHPAIARVFATLLAGPGGHDGPPPVFFAVPPGLVSDLLLVVAIVHDWRTRGRPHRVYVIGGAMMLAEQILVVPIAASAWWMASARAFQGILG